MITYHATLTSAAAQDLFNGNSSTGKWVVQFTVFANSATIWLSTDGTTHGAGVSSYDVSGKVSVVYSYVVENQPLYLIASNTNASFVDVVITPFIGPDITLSTC